MMGARPCFDYEVIKILISASGFDSSVELVPVAN